MMADPRTVERMLLAVRKQFPTPPNYVHDWGDFQAVVWAEMYHGEYRYLCGRRNTWKRPPWQIGRRVNAKQVKR